jgi:hypothetical protein
MSAADPPAATRAAAAAGAIGERLRQALFKRDRVRDELVRAARFEVERTKNTWRKIGKVLGHDRLALGLERCGNDMLVVWIGKPHGISEQRVKVFTSASGNARVIPAIARAARSSASVNPRSA